MNRFTLGRYALSQTIVFLSWAPVCLFVVNHVGTVGFISGVSMQPTFNPNSNKRWRDIVLLRKWGLHLAPGLDIGDVVVLRSPLDPEVCVTKRIVALGGDTIKTRPPYKQEYVQIPPGHAWVEGDERFHSRDSNEYGPVSLALVEAKVTRILWPWDRAGKLSTKAGRDPRITSFRSSTAALDDFWDQSRK